MFAVDHEHRQIVVAGEIRAGRLDDVEVGEPSDVVHDAFLRTLYPPFTRSAPDETGYQKCEPVSGSEYDRVPIVLPAATGRMYLSISSGVARSMMAFTAPMCIT